MDGLTSAPAIDLRRHHFMHPFKDIACFGSWLFNADQEDVEPCLVLVPRYRRNGFKPAVIALSSAFKYNDATYLARAAVIFNRDLGFADDLANAHKVADAINMYLGDLLSMPENPTTTVIGADATVTIGGKTRTVELLDYQSTEQL
jgi:hypothetical protein